MTEAYGPPRDEVARPPSTQRETIRPGKESGAAWSSRKPDDPLSAEYLLNILNSSGFTKLVFDRSLKLGFFTLGATSLFNLSSTPIGRSIQEIPCYFRDPDLVTDAEMTIATGIPINREVEADSGAWFNRSIAPYLTRNKDVQGVVVTFADISVLKLAEREIEASRAYANSIVDTIRQPLVVLDHELRIVSASPSFYRMFVITPASAVGRRLPDLRDRCLDVEALRAFLDRTAAGHAVIENQEVEIDLPPRGKRVLQLNAHEIPAVPPDKPRTLLAIDDITDGKRISMALEAAKKHAERANLGKSRFLAAASHDLRQPLQILVLLHGILTKKVTDADVLRLIGRFGDSLDAMSGMLNKLLDINQLEAGIVSPEIADFPIAVLLDRLRNDFSHRDESSALSCRVVSSRQTIRSDPTLLEQILRNLTSNALKYTAEGKIVVGCRRRGDRLRIEIWDTGSGIPESQLRAIFEEFHQLDNPARERSRGLGLGPSIVQRLADLLGHTIDVRSHLGKGSVFSIEVPCAEADPEAAELPARRPAAGINGGETILVVEDDPILRETLQFLFEMEGYRTQVPGDGKAALQLVESGGLRPDILVADYNLPNGLTGLEVALRLREIFDKRFPAIIVTGDISANTLRSVADAGCIQLNKPIKGDDLSRLVRSQLAMLPPKDEVVSAPLVIPAQNDLVPTVFLIDDDNGLREVMRELIEREGRPVRAFASSEAFLRAYRPESKGCLLVDARLPGMDGLALLQRLKAENTNLRSIMITGHGEVAIAVEAMKAGAIDFIEKPFQPEELLASIERALELARDSSTLSIWRDTAAKRMASLTKREKEIMDLVIIGRPNKIIAADLGVSQRTVENHRAAVMKKTKSKSLTDLVRLSISVI